MTSIMFRASDLDERLNHRSQNERLTDQLGRRPAEPRFAIVWASVAEGPTQIQTMQSGDALHRFAYQPMRRVVAGVRDNDTGAWLSVEDALGTVWTAVCAAFGLEDLS